MGTDRAEYTIGDRITLTGKVSKVVEGYALTIQVFNPNNSGYTFAQINVQEDKSFVYEFVVGGKLGVPGEYTIRTTYAGATSSTTIKLMPAEKASYTIQFAGETIDVTYDLKNGKLKNIEVDPEFLSILILIEGDEDRSGSLEITLPRQLLDANKDKRDSSFFVFIDGEESLYKEIGTAKESRTLLIDLPEDSRDIEIVGTSVIPEFSAGLALALAIGSVVIIMIAIKKEFKPNSIHPCHSNLKICPI